MAVEVKAPGVATPREGIPDPAGTPEGEPAPPTGAQYDALLKVQQRLEDKLSHQPRGFGPDQVTVARGMLANVSAARLDPATTGQEVAQAAAAFLDAYEAANPVLPSPPEPAPASRSAAASIGR